MDYKFFYHKCSPDYLDSISSDLMNGISRTIKMIPKSSKKDALLADFFWLLVADHWCFHCPPTGLGAAPPKQLSLSVSLSDIKKANDPGLCATSEKIKTGTQSDYAKLYGSQLVQLEIQLAGMEEVAKDFTKFRIAFAEKRIGLGVELVLVNPGVLSENKTGKKSLAYFAEAKNMLPMLNLDCPIWLIGIE